MTNKENRIRESNFELLRIISMLMVVILHFGTHGFSRYVNIPTFLTGINEFIYYFIRSLSIIAVNLYVLVSGYFLYKSQFKLKKLINLFLMTSFFSTIIYILCILLGYTDFTFVSFIKSLFAVFFEQYWFVSLYFIMYILSPYLNRLIDHLNKKEHFNLLLILVLITTVWQFIYPIANIGVASGYGLIYFLFLYLLAAYIRKYNFIMFDFGKNVYLILFIFLALFNAIIIYKFNDSLGQLYNYNSPITLLMSYCLFLYFKQIKIKSRIINFTSVYVFGIYLIHEHPVVREILWSKLGIIEDVISTQTNFIILKFVCFSLLIFISCWFVSLILNTIFNILFNKIFYCNRQ
ncbi:acyltransferase [Bacillus sp. 1NLA3E]|uniref:acyltransferase n=1 Tax=Bacillus sp. 1NLA3E TaxID=666686 RepID=UPI000247EC34|nr:hypothetical protein B1NLA3E_19990 [Bacillus sp. 1NLA3E]